MEEKGRRQPGSFKSLHAAIGASEKTVLRTLKAHICPGLRSQRNLPTHEQKLQPMEAALFWKPGLEGTAKDTLISWGHDKYCPRVRNSLLSLQRRKCS